MNAPEATDQERPRRRRAAPEPAAPEPTEHEEPDADETEHDETEHDEAAGAPEDGELDEDAGVDDPVSAPEPEADPAPKRIPARKIARWAMEQVMEMTGKESESVTSVRKTDEGWSVGLEVVESRRIPESTDLLAIYEAEMDGDGELISYRRTKRYTRGRGDDE